MGIPKGAGIQMGYVEPVYASMEALLQRTVAHPRFEAVLLRRLRRPAELHWFSLPILCHQAVGGNAEHAIPVAAAFELARLAANILDAVEDGDAGDALWQAVGMPQATNLGTALIFAATLALADLRRLGTPSDTVATLQADFARTGFRMCEGQHLDLSTGAGVQGGTGEKVTSGENVPFTPAPQHPGTPAQDGPLHAYWQIAEAKSGAFFALGCRAGALLGDATDAECNPYARFGRHLGLLAQVVNDMAGLLGDAGSSDVAGGKPTLPILYAFSVATGMEYAQLSHAWAEAVHDDRARADVRRIAIELGAAQYVFVVAEQQYQQALTSLERTAGEPDALTQLKALLDLHRPASFRHLVGERSAC